MAALTDVESRSLEARARLVSGEFVIQTEYKNTAGFGTPASDNVLQREFHYWFTGENVRSDMRERRDDGTWRPREVKCLSDGYHTAYSELVPDGSTGVAVRITDTNYAEAPINERVVPHPRELGMLPTSLGNLIYFPTASSWWPQRRGVTRLDKDTLEGIECHRVSYRHASGMLIRTWIAESLDWSVLRMEATTKSGGATTIETVASTVDLHAASGLFLPTSVVYQSHIDGKLAEEQVIQLRPVSINEPVDSHQFTLAGIGVPRGQTIVWFPPDPRGRFVWDGRELTPRKTFESLGYRSWITWRAMGLGASAILAVFATYYAYYAFKSTRSRA